MLLQIEEIQLIAKSDKGTVEGISESKLDKSLVKHEIFIDSYITLRCDRDRYKGCILLHCWNVEMT